MGFILQRKQAVDGGNADKKSDETKAKEASNVQQQDDRANRPNNAEPQPVPPPSQSIQHAPIQPAPLKATVPNLLLQLDALHSLGYGKDATRHHVQ